MGAGNLLGNRGEILNTGVELSFNWADKIGKDFSYYIGANLTTLHNEVKDLNGLSYLYGGSAEFRTISQVGGELNAYYGYDIEVFIRMPQRSLLIRLLQQMVWSPEISIC